MCYLKVFSLFLFINCALAEQNSLLIACAVEDIECLSASTQTFLGNAAAGIPDYDIKAIDPFIIPSIDLLKIKPNFLANLKNVNITGMKTLKISDFTMDTKLKSVLLELKADLNIVADATVVLPEKSKTFSGNYMAKATTLGTFKYNYEIKTDDKGVEHFDVGPETITCVGLNNPQITLDPQFAESIYNDPDTNLTRDGDNMVELRKNYVCEIAVVGFHTIVHNLRAIAKLLPKSAFFTNV